MPDHPSPEAVSEDPGNTPAGDETAISRRRDVTDVRDLGDKSDKSVVAVDAADLRSALEFAVMIAREGQKVRPKVPYPAPLKRYLSQKHLSPTALVVIRNTIEADPEFRQRLAAGALPELVDPIGRLWLTRPVGWRDQVDSLIADKAVAARSADAETRLRRAEKQRDAAQAAAARLQADLVMTHDRIAEHEHTLDELRAEVVKANEELEALRDELVDARNEVRHARDRERAANERMLAAEAARDADASARRDAEEVRDVALADRAATSAQHGELARLASTAQALADRLTELLGADESSTVAPSRSPLRLPGGVVGDSAAAAEFLLRSGASIIVDGYNVAMSAWPGLALIQQRQRLLDGVENVARRFGGDITVVFDGADVVGASASGRRLVRVVYSPADVIADDIIRDEVARLPAGRPVVVVTNDQAIVRDVRAVGANTLTSEQLIELLR